MLSPFYRRILLAGGCAVALCESRATPAGSPGTSASLDERIILVPPAGSEREDREILLWQKRVTAGRETGPNGLGTYERLGWSFVAKARRTLDAGYYKLAEKTAEVMDVRFGPSDEALLLRGHVDHNLH